MTSNNYIIKKWNVKQISSNEKRPLITIKPTQILIDFAKKNRIIKLQIKNTNTLYDNILIEGVIITEYFKNTGYYNILLNSFWYGYPKNKSHNGIVHFPDIKGLILSSSNPSSSNPSSSNPSSSNPSSSNLSSELLDNIIWFFKNYILFWFFIVILLLFWKKCYLK